MEEVKTTSGETPEPKTPAPQINALQVFEGTWVIEGHNFGDAPNGGDSKVTGTMTNKWLAGKYFMLTEWAYQFEKGQHIGSGVMGVNEHTNELFVKNFDNMGYERMYEISIYKNTWNFNGAQERAVLVFNGEGNTYEEKWELVKDGEWEPLCERQGIKKA